MVQQLQLNGSILLHILKLDTCVGAAAATDATAPANWVDRCAIKRHCNPAFIRRIDARPGSSSK
jgi:hypothetical protein